MIGIQQDSLLVSGPEAYIGKAQELVDSDGNILNPDTAKFFQLIVDKFVEHIERN